jgi:hypothetical protein
MSAKNDLKWFRRLMEERNLRYQSEIESGKEAIRVALTALNERVANLNELRGIVTDQSKNLITRNEVVSQITNLSEGLTKVEKALSESTGAASQSKESKARLNWIVGAIIGGIGLLIAAGTFGVAILPKLLK